MYMAFDHMFYGLTNLETLDITDFKFLAGAFSNSNSVFYNAGSAVETGLEIILFFSL